jgi:hypothetical protein
LKYLCFACIGGCPLPGDVVLLVLSFYPCEYFGSVCKQWDIAFCIHLKSGWSRHVCINDTYALEPVIQRYRSLNTLYLRVNHIPIKTPLKQFQNISYLRVGVHTHCDFDVLKFLRSYQDSKPGHVFNEVSVYFSFDNPFPYMPYQTSIKTLHLDVSSFFCLFVKSILTLCYSFPTTPSLSLRLLRIDSRPFIHSIMSSFRMLQHLHIQCAPYIPHPGHLYLTQIKDSDILQLDSLSSLTCYVQTPDLNKNFDVFDWVLRSSVRIQLRWITLAGDVALSFGSGISDCVSCWDYRSSHATNPYCGYAVLTQCTFSEACTPPIAPGTYDRKNTQGYSCETRAVVPLMARWVRNWQY